MNDTFENRFNNLVKRSKKGCWLWKGTPKSVYGRVSLDGRKVYAHRVAYEMWVGPIPNGCIIHHKCGNTRCVRPSHLQAIGQGENVAEMLQRRQYIKAIERLEKEVRKLRQQLEEK